MLEEGQKLEIATFNKVLMDANDKVLGYKKNKEEKIIKGDTWNKIDETQGRNEE